MHKIFVPSAEANKRVDEMDWEPRGTSSTGDRREITQALFAACSQNENIFSSHLMRAPAAPPCSEGFGRPAYTELRPSRCHESFERRWGGALLSARALRRERYRFWREWVPSPWGAARLPWGTLEGLFPLWLRRRVTRRQGKTVADSRRGPPGAAAPLPHGRTEKAAEDDTPSRRPTVLRGGCAGEA